MYECVLVEKIESLKIYNFEDVQKFDLSFLNIYAIHFLLSFFNILLRHFIGLSFIYFIILLKIFVYVIR